MQPHRWRLTEDPVRAVQGAAGWHTETVLGFGILLSRLVAVVVLVFIVLTGQYMRENHDATLTAVVIALLVCVGLGALSISSGSHDPGLGLPRSVELAGLIILVVSGSALCALVPDASPLPVPLVTASLVPRVISHRVTEYLLVLCCMVGPWVSVIRSDVPLWWGLAAAAGVITTYQLGLRGRERAERAEHAELLLAREQVLMEQRELAAAAAERARIARDLHDVLAHTLSGLSITLQGASVLFGAGRTDEGIGQVERSKALAAEGLLEARQALAALEPTEGARAVDLGQALDRMVRDHRVMTGVPITSDFDDRLSTLDPRTVEVTLAVVREALTNTIRHAPKAPVQLAARLSNDKLEVVVANDEGQPSAPPSKAGMGLRGMLHRAQAAGGDMVAGPTPTGWAVVLSLPAPPEQAVQRTRLTTFPNQRPGTLGAAS